MHLRTSLPRLLCSALVIAGLASLPEQASAAPGPNLVKNGGFESGSLSSWGLIGDQTFNGVQCSGAPEGSCDAFFGPVGTTGGITQSIATTVGAQYFISFILISTGDNPSSFTADFGASNLLTLSNPNTGTTTFSFLRTATAASTLLRFNFQDDPGFMLLDAVQVIPEPATVALVGLALLGLGASRRRKTH